MIEWQKRSTKPWLRLIAFITLITFTATNISWAEPNGPNASAPKNQLPDISPALLENLKKAELVLPDSFGQIKKSFQGSRNKIVIHIQDAHANEKAQRNIANILNYFARTQGLKLINLEGAEGELYTKLFSFFPYKKARENAADYFLKQARLTGPEYLAIVERPDVKLYGVEDHAIYEENRKAYLDALEFKNRDEKTLQSLGKALNDVSRFIFSSEMNELARRRSSFQEGGRELVSYVRYLVETAQRHNIALYDYAGMNALLTLIELEKKVDFDKAEEEIEEFTKDLKKIISHEKMSRFLTNTIQFRMKKIKRSEYYGYIQDEIKGTNAYSSEDTQAEDISIKYQNVLNYLQYMRLYDSIGIEIFDEIEALEKGIKNKLFDSPEQVELDRLIRIYETYQKMFDFTLTKQDADFFYNYRDSFKVKTFRKFLTPMLPKYHFDYSLPESLETIDEDLPRIEHFYNAAIRRDSILIDRAIQKMEQDHQDICAIVTGGFHTPGIEHYLKEHEYSYLVIAPKISKEINAEKDSKLYQDAMAEKPLALEKMLMESFLPHRSGILNDPRFQLAAPHTILPRNELAEQIAQGKSSSSTVLIRLLMTLSMFQGGHKAFAAMQKSAPSDFEGMGNVWEQLGKSNLRKKDGRFGPIRMIYQPEDGGTYRVTALYPKTNRSEVRMTPGLDRIGETDTIPVGKNSEMLTVSGVSSHLIAQQSAPIRAKARKPSRKSAEPTPQEELNKQLRDFQNQIDKLEEKLIKRFGHENLSMASVNIKRRLSQARREIDALNEVQSKWLQEFEKNKVRGSRTMQRQIDEFAVGTQEKPKPIRKLYELIKTTETKWKTRKPIPAEEISQAKISRKVTLRESYINLFEAYRLFDERVRKFKASENQAQDNETIRKFSRRLSALERVSRDLDLERNQNAKENSGLKDLANGISKLQTQATNDLNSVIQKQSEIKPKIVPLVQQTEPIPTQVAKEKAKQVREKARELWQFSSIAAALVVFPFSKGFSIAAAFSIASFWILPKLTQYFQSGKTKARSQTKKIASKKLGLESLEGRQLLSGTPWEKQSLVAPLIDHSPAEIASSPAANALTSEKRNTVFFGTSILNQENLKIAAGEQIEKLSASFSPQSGGNNLFVESVDIIAENKIRSLLDGNKKSPADIGTAEFDLSVPKIANEKTQAQPTESVTSDFESKELKALGIEKIELIKTAKGYDLAVIGTDGKEITRQENLNISKEGTFHIGFDATKNEELPSVQESILTIPVYNDETGKEQEPVTIDISALTSGSRELINKYTIYGREDNFFDRELRPSNEEIARGYTATFDIPRGFAKATGLFLYSLPLGSAEPSHSVEPSKTDNGGGSSGGSGGGSNSMSGNKYVEIHNEATQKLEVVSVLDESEIPSDISGILKDIFKRELKTESEKKNPAVIEIVNIHGKYFLIFVNKDGDQIKEIPQVELPSLITEGYTHPDSTKGYYRLGLFKNVGEEPPKINVDNNTMSVTFYQNKDKTNEKTTITFSLDTGKVIVIETPLTISSATASNTITAQATSLARPAVQNAAPAATLQAEVIPVVTILPDLEIIKLINQKQANAGSGLALVQRALQIESELPDDSPEKGKTSGFIASISVHIAQDTDGALRFHDRPTVTSESTLRPLLDFLNSTNNPAKIFGSFLAGDVPGSVLVKGGGLDKGREILENPTDARITGILTAEFFYRFFNGHEGPGRYTDPNNDRIPVNNPTEQLISRVTEGFEIFNSKNKAVLNYVNFITGNVTGNLRELFDGMLENIPPSGETAGRVYFILLNVRSSNKGELAVRAPLATFLSLENFPLDNGESFLQKLAPDDQLIDWGTRKTDIFPSMNTVQVPPGQKFEDILNHLGISQITFNGQTTPSTDLVGGGGGGGGSIVVPSGGSAGGGGGGNFAANHFKPVPKMHRTIKKIQKVDTESVVQEWELNADILKELKKLGKFKSEPAAIEIIYENEDGTYYLIFVDRDGNPIEEIEEKEIDAKEIPLHTQDYQIRTSENKNEKTSEATLQNKTLTFYLYNPQAKSKEIPISVKFEPVEAEKIKGIEESEETIKKTDEQRKLKDQLFGNENFINDLGNDLLNIAIKITKGIAPDSSQKEIPSGASNAPPAGSSASAGSSARSEARAVVSGWRKFLIAGLISINLLGNISQALSQTPLPPTAQTVTQKEDFSEYMFRKFKVNPEQFRNHLEVAIAKGKPTQTIKHSTIDPMWVQKEFKTSREDLIKFVQELFGKELKLPLDSEDSFKAEDWLDKFILPAMTILDIRGHQDQEKRFMESILKTAPITIRGFKHLHEKFDLEEDEEIPTMWRGFLLHSIDEDELRVVDKTWLKNETVPHVKLNTFLGVLLFLSRIEYNQLSTEEMQKKFDMKDAPNLYGWNRHKNSWSNPKNFFNFLGMSLNKGKPFTQKQRSIVGWFENVVASHYGDIFFFKSSQEVEAARRKRIDELANMISEHIYPHLKTRYQHIVPAENIARAFFDSLMATKAYWPEEAKDKSILEVLRSDQYMRAIMENAILPMAEIDKAVTALFDDYDDPVVKEIIRRFRKGDFSWEDAKHVVRLNLNPKDFDFSKLPPDVASRLPAQLDIKNRPGLSESAQGDFRQHDTKNIVETAVSLHFGRLQAIVRHAFQKGQIKIVSVRRNVKGQTALKIKINSVVLRKQLEQMNEIVPYIQVLFGGKKFNLNQSTDIGTLFAMEESMTYLGFPANEWNLLLDSSSPPTEKDQEDIRTEKEGIQNENRNLLAAITRNKVWEEKGFDFSNQETGPQQIGFVLSRVMGRYLEGWQKTETQTENLISILENNSQSPTKEELTKRRLIIHFANQLEEIFNPEIKPVTEEEIENNIDAGGRVLGEATDAEMSGVIEKKDNKPVINEEKWREWEITRQKQIEVLKESIKNRPPSSRSELRKNWRDINYIDPRIWALKNEAQNKKSLWQRSSKFIAKFFFIALIGFAAIVTTVQLNAQEPAKSIPTVKTKKIDVIGDVQKLIDFRFKNNPAKAMDVWKEMKQNPRARGLILGRSKFRTTYEDDLATSLEKTAGAVDEIITTLSALEKDKEFGPVFFENISRLYWLDQERDLAKAIEKAKKTNTLEFFRNNDNAWSFLEGFVGAMAVDFQQPLSNNQITLPRYQEYTYHASNFFYAVTQLQDLMKTYYVNINRGNQNLDPTTPEENLRQEIWGEYAVRTKMLESLMGGYITSDLKDVSKTIENAHQAMKATMQELIRIQTAAIDSTWGQLDDAEVSYFYKLFYTTTIREQITKRIDANRPADTPYSSLVNPGNNEKLTIEKFFELLKFATQMRSKAATNGDPHLLSNKDGRFNMQEGIVPHFRKYLTREIEKPFWMTDEDAKRVIDFIDGQKGLKNEPLLSGEAVQFVTDFLDRQSASSQTWEGFDITKQEMVRETRLEMFLQAIYMLHHDTRLSIPDLSSWRDLIKSRFYDAEQVGGILRDHGVFQEMEKNLRKRLIDTFPNSQVDSQLRAFYPWQRLGFVVRMHAAGKSEQWLQDWFNDVFLIQQASYRSFGNFVHPVLLSYTVERFRENGEAFRGEKDYRVGRMRAFFNSVAREDLNYMPLNETDDDLRGLLMAWHNVFHVMPSESEIQNNLANWKKIETLLKAKDPSITEDKIHMIQDEFIARRQMAQTAFTNLISDEIYRLHPDKDLYSLLAPAVNETQNVITEPVINLMGGLSGREQRKEDLRVSKAKEVEITRPLLAHIHEQRAMRKQDALNRNVEKIKEEFRKIHSDYTKTHKNAKPLTERLLNIYANQTLEHGFSVEEAHMRYVDLEYQVAEVYHSIHGNVQPAGLSKEEEVYFISSLAERIFSDWGLTDSHDKEEIIKKYGATVEQAIQKELSRLGQVLKIALMIQRGYQTHTGLTVSYQITYRMADNSYNSAVNIEDIEQWLKLSAEIKKIVKEKLEIDLLIDDALYYADSLLKIGLAKVPQVKEWNADQIQNIVQKELARINLNDPKIVGLISDQIKFRNVSPVQIKILVDRVISLDQRIKSAIRENETRSITSDRLKTPRGTYDLRELSSMDLLFLLDDYDMHPSIHVGLGDIREFATEYSREKLEEYVARPVNAMVREEAAKLLREKVAVSEWLKNANAFERWRWSWNHPEAKNTLTPGQQKFFGWLENLGAKDNVWLAFFIALIWTLFWSTRAAYKLLVHKEWKKENPTPLTPEDHAEKEKYEKREKMILFSRFLPYTTATRLMTSFLAASSFLIYNTNSMSWFAAIYSTATFYWLVWIIMEIYIGKFLVYVATAPFRNYYRHRLKPPINANDITPDKSMVIINPLRPASDNQLRAVIKKSVSTLQDIVSTNGNHMNVISVLILQAVGDSRETYDRYERILREEIYDNPNVPQHVKDRFSVMQMRGIAKPHNMYKLMRWFYQTNESDDPYTTNWIFGVKTEDDLATYQTENGLAYFGGTSPAETKGAKGGILATPAGMENLKRLRNNGDPLLENFLILDADNYTTATTVLRMINTMNDDFMVWQPRIQFYNREESVYALLKDFPNEHLGNMAQGATTFTVGGIRSFGKYFGRFKKYVKTEVLENQYQRIFPWDFRFLQSEDAYHGIFDRAAYLNEPGLVIYEATPASIIDDIAREETKWMPTFDMRNTALLHLPTIKILTNLRASLAVSGTLSLLITGGLVWSLGALSLAGITVLAILTVLSWLITGGIYSWYDSSQTPAAQVRIDALRNKFMMPHIPVRGEYSESLVNRGILSESIWATQIILTIYAMINPGVLEVAFPFFGDTMFNFLLMLPLLHPKFSMPFMSRVLKVFWPGYDDNGNKNSRLKALFELVVYWPLYDVPVGVAEFLVSTSIYLTKLTIKPTEVLFASLGVYKEIRLMLRGDSTSGTWPSFVESEVTFPFITLLVKFRAALTSGLLAVMLTVPHFKPLMAIPFFANAFSPSGIAVIATVSALILGVIPFIVTVSHAIHKLSVTNQREKDVQKRFNLRHLIFGIQKKYVDAANKDQATHFPGESTYPTLRRLIGSGLIAGSLIIVGFFSGNLHSLIPADLMIRASTIVIGSFIFGPAIAWMTGVMRGKDAGKFNPPERKSIVTVAMALLIGYATIVATIWFSVSPETVHTNPVLAMLAPSGDGSFGVLLPQNLLFSEMTRVPWYFAVFFTSIVYGTVVVGTIAYLWGTVAMLRNILIRAYIRDLDHYIESHLQEATPKDIEEQAEELILRYQLLPGFGQNYIRERAKQLIEWKKVERKSSDPLPEINARPRWKKWAGAGAMTLVTIGIIVFAFFKTLEKEGPHGLNAPTQQERMTDAALLKTANWQVIGTRDTGPQSSPIKTTAGDFSEIKILSQTNGREVQTFSVKGNGFLRAAVPGMDWGTSYILPGYWAGDAYYHNPLIKEVNFSVLPDGRLQMKGLFADKAGNFESKDFTVTFNAVQDKTVEAEVSFSITAKKEFRVDPARQRRHEGFRIIQFSSMNIRKEWDADHVRYMDKGGKEISSDLSKQEQFIFSRPTSSNGNLSLVLENTKPSPGRNTPHAYVHFGSGFQTTPQGWVNHSNNPNDDTVNIWINYDDASSYTPGTVSGPFKFILGVSGDPVVLKPNRSEVRVETFDEKLIKSWQNKMDQGNVFQYSLSQIVEKMVGKFYVQNNPGRAERDKQIGRLDRKNDNNNVVIPFGDTEHFEGSQTNFNEIYDKFPAQELFERMIEKTRVIFGVNYAPIVKNHFLVVPEPKLKLPQVLTEFTIRIAFKIIDTVSKSSDMLLGFNSLGSWASINHFHFQGAFFPLGSLAIDQTEKAKGINLGNGVRVSQLKDYPLNGLLFTSSNRNRKALIQSIAAYVRLLQSQNIPHTFILRKNGAYALPFARAERPEFGTAGLSFMESAGYFYLTAERFQDITEERLIAGMKQTTLEKEKFDQVLGEYLNQMQPKRSEVRQERGFIPQHIVDDNIYSQARNHYFDQTIDPALKGKVAEAISEADLVIGIPVYQEDLPQIISVITRLRSALQIKKTKTAILLGGEVESADLLARLDTSAWSSENVKVATFIKPNPETDQENKGKMDQKLLVPFRGKPWTVRGFMQAALKARDLQGADLLIVDADINFSHGRESSDSLLKALLKPIHDSNIHAQFVTLDAPRYYFDDDAIVHLFSYLFTASVYGVKLHQSHGGEFAMSKDIVRVLLSDELEIPFDNTYEVEHQFAIRIASDPEQFAIKEVQMRVKSHKAVEPQKIFDRLELVIRRLFEDAIRHHNELVQKPLHGFSRHIAVDFSRTHRTRSDRYDTLEMSELLSPEYRKLLFNEYKRQLLEHKKTGIYQKLLSEKQMEKLIKLSQEDENAATENFRFSVREWAHITSKFLIAYATTENKDKAESLVKAYLPIVLAGTLHFATETQEMSYRKARQVIDNEGKNSEYLRPLRKGALDAFRHLKRLQQQRSELRKTAPEATEHLKEALSVPAEMRFNQTMGNEKAEKFATKFDAAIIESLAQTPEMLEALEKLGVSNITKPFDGRPQYLIQYGESFDDGFIQKAIDKRPAKTDIFVFVSSETDQMHLINKFGSKIYVLLNQDLGNYISNLAKNSKLNGQIYQVMNDSSQSEFMISASLGVEGLPVGIVGAKKAISGATVIDLTMIENAARSEQRVAVSA